MVRRKPRTSQKMRKPKKRSTSGEMSRNSLDEGLAQASTAQATRPPPWGFAEVYFGLAHFVAAACLFAVSRLPEGAATTSTGMPPFAAGFTAVLCLLGVLWTGFGVARGRSQSPRPSRFDELHPHWFFLQTWRNMDREAETERATRHLQGKGYDYRPILTLCGGAVFLSVMEYYGGSRTFLQILNWLGDGAGPENVFRALPQSPYFRLIQFAWWAGCRVLGYLVLPMAIIRATGGRTREHGLETNGFKDHVWIYGFGYYIVFVCVVVVSYTDEFSTYYPFYKLANRSGFDFLCWELLYAAQFFSLEFFFRGWWLKAMKPMMGSHAIFVMVVPYCMIHYGKPFPETLAAIIAGLFLGTLAMKTRSIWSGFLIHVSVAISMDAAALIQTRGLPEAFWPAL